MSPLVIMFLRRLDPSQPHPELAQPVLQRVEPSAMFANMEVLATGTAEMF